MSVYDFDKIWDRWGTDASKWELTTDKSGPYRCSVKREDIIPMWIADMDFATAPSVTQAISQRLCHPIFGHTEIPDRYINAISSWHERRFRVYGIGRQHIMHHTSVLGAVSCAITQYTRPNDSILMTETTYSGFPDTAKALGRNICLSPLYRDESGVFRMDFADIEKQIVEKSIPIFVFCSPHNPTGRVWERWEIEKIVDICARHNVLIISDEIWSDLVLQEGVRHIPTQSVNDTAKNITIALYAPTKTFNLAAILTSYSIIYNPEIAQKIKKASAATRYNGVDILALAACWGAYEGGEEWLEELIKYIRKNMEYMHDFFTRQCIGITADMPQGTYLLWVNVDKTGMDIGEVVEKLKNVGVIVSDGRSFNGKTHLRFNLACPFSTVVRACEAMKKVFPLNNL